MLMSANISWNTLQKEYTSEFLNCYIEPLNGLKTYRKGFHAVFCLLIEAQKMFARFSVLEYAMILSPLSIGQQTIELSLSYFMEQVHSPSGLWIF